MSTAGRGYQVAWVPIAVLFAIIAVLSTAPPGMSRDWPVLHSFLSFTFMTVPCLLVALLMARSYMSRRAPGLLLLGCGAVVWGAANMMAPLAAMQSGGRMGANINVTIHNLGAGLAALLSLAGASLLLREQKRTKSAVVWLAAGYAGALSLAGLVTHVTLAGWTPLFFVDGQGGTPIRSVVLCSAIAMVALAAILVRLGRRGVLPAFLYWYSYGLGLIAVGLLGVLGEHSAGSSLNWMGRGAEWLGGAYLMIAVIASVRGSREWDVSLELALHESEARFRSIYEQAAVGIAEIDNADQFVMVNTALCRMLGYAESELLGKRRDEITYPEDDDREKPLLEALLHGGLKSYEIEKRYLHRNGTPVWVNLTSSPVRDEAGNLLYRISVVQDIQERKLAEQRIAHLANFPKLNPTPVFETDLAGSITYANPVAMEQLPELLEMEAGENLLKDWPLIVTALKVVGSKALVREIEADGRIWTQRIHYAPGLEVLRTYMEDITERREAEEALKASERRYRDLAELVPALLWAADANGVTTDHNQRWFDYTGQPRERGGGDAWRDVVHPDDTAQVAERWAEAGRTGKDYSNEFRVWCAAEKKYRWHAVHATTRQDESGQTLGWFGAYIDIDDRKRAEEALFAANQRLNESEKLYRAVGELINYGIWVSTPEGVSTYNSESFLQLLGLRQEEWTRTTWNALLHPDDRERTIAAWQECAQSGKEYDIEHRYRGADGRWHPILTRGVAVRDDQGQITCWVGINLDISNMKRAELALLRSEKLASAGRMAAAIAHEINNPLEAVGNLLYLARSESTLPVASGHYLDMADAELKRIAHITRQSLGFYRESSTPETTSIDAVLDSAIDLLKSKIRAKRVTVEKECSGEAEVRAVAGELRQVFCNLLANSLDAIAPGGKIRVRVSSVTVFKDGERWVRVTLGDNGGGIIPSIRPHLFEPFFTTKGSIGTGLGLWVTKQIVDKHGGNIRVRSSVEGERRGTVFCVLLPEKPPEDAWCGEAGDD